MTVPAAVLTAVSAALPVDVVVYDGSVPTEPATRYVVVYADDGTLAALAACGVSDSATFRFQTTAVAPDRGMASWLAVRIRDAIVDSRPTAAGWTCGPVRHTFSQLPQRDEAVMERLQIYRIDQYALLAFRS